MKWYGWFLFLFIVAFLLGLFWWVGSDVSPLDYHSEPITSTESVNLNSNGVVVGSSEKGVESALNVVLRDVSFDKEAYVGKYLEFEATPGFAVAYSFKGEQGVLYTVKDQEGYNVQVFSTSGRILSIGDSYLFKGVFVKSDSVFNPVYYLEVN